MLPSPKEILFFDIETAPIRPPSRPKLFSVSVQEDGSLPSIDTNYYDPSDPILMWKKRYWKPESGLSPEEHYYKNAGLYPEFSQVVCISFGLFFNDERKFDSIIGKEWEILHGLFTVFCMYDIRFYGGHNIKNFDIPFLMRRYIINKMSVPQQLNTYGKKPRELFHIIDTMEIWKGTGFSSTSLEVCSLALGLPNPKEEVEGSSVAQMFYGGQIDKIREYCEGDVKATMRLYNEMYKYL